MNGSAHTLGDAWREGFEETRRLTTSHLDGVEPFGFVDGISQPAVDWEQRRDPSKGERRDIATRLRLASSSSDIATSTGSTPIGP